MPATAALTGCDSGLELSLPGALERDLAAPAEAQPEAACEIAWRAQLQLARRYHDGQMKCANQPADISMINVGNNALAASRDLFRRVFKNWESMRTSQDCVRTFGFHLMRLRRIAPTWESVTTRGSAERSGLTPHHCLRIGDRPYDRDPLDEPLASVSSRT